MKTDFNDSMLHDDTTTDTEITTEEQFSKNLQIDEDRENEDALIQIQSTRTQIMDVEDFMELVENKATSIHNIDQTIEKQWDAINDYENAYDGEMELMARLDKERKSDTSREPVDHAPHGSLQTASGRKTANRRLERTERKRHHPVRRYVGDNHDFV